MEPKKGESKRKKRRGRSWIRFAVVVFLFLPAFLIIPFLPEKELVKFTKLKVTEASIFHKPQLFCQLTNTGKEPILLQGTTAIAEQKGTTRTWILPQDRRQITLGSKESTSFLYNVEKLRGVGEFRIRLSRFREPSTWDNILHWLSRHFPGQENQRKIREKIGPNSANIYSEWIPAPALEDQ